TPTISSRGRRTPTFIAACWTPSCAVSRRNPEAENRPMLFPPTLAGSLPKPGWLAETAKLWPKWRLDGEALAEAKRDAALLWIKEQEDAGIETVSDGEQFRIHFVH